MSQRRPTPADLLRGFMPPVVERYDPERVKASNIAGKVKRAAAEALKNSGRSREAVAAVMGEYLGEDVKTSVLAQYTSTANDTHNIPAHRLIALFVATGDLKLLNTVLEGTGAIVVDAKYEALIRREMLSEARAQIEAEHQAADQEWRKGR
jgi:hypothetical protein